MSNLHTSLPDRVSPASGRTRQGAVQVRDRELNGEKWGSSIRNL